MARTRWAVTVTFAPSDSGATEASTGKRRIRFYGSVDWMDYGLGITVNFSRAFGGVSIKLGPFYAWLAYEELHTVVEFGP